MYKLITLIACLTVGLVASTAMAQVQAACKERNDTLTMLAKKYQESPVAAGVTYNGHLVEVLTTDDGNTWTIIVSMPNGMSCMVAAGEGWRTMRVDSNKFDPEA